MLNAIDVYYKFTNFEFYIEFIRQLHNININFEKNVHYYYARLVNLTSDGHRMESDGQRLGSGWAAVEQRLGSN